MHYDAQENSGQITIEMLQRAYAESVKPYANHAAPVIFCLPHEVPMLKELMDRIYGE